VGAEVEAEMGEPVVGEEAEARRQGAGGGDEVG